MLKKTDKFITRDEFIRGSTLIKDYCPTLCHLTRVHVCCYLFPNTHSISSRMHLGNLSARKCSQPMTFSLCIDSDYLLFRSKPLPYKTFHPIFFPQYNIEYAILSTLSTVCLFHFFTLYVTVHSHYQ